MNDSAPINPELLQAYVDGELDAATVARVEAMLSEDATAAGYVAQQRALRARLQAAFQPVLEEELPPRLELAVRALAESERQERASPVPRPGPASSWAALCCRLRGFIETRMPASPVGGGAWAGAGMVSCLLLGLWIGKHLPPGEGAWMTFSGEGWMAQGPLAEALSTRLAAAQRADDPVRLGPSFASKTGAYCRSFLLPAQGSAGLACRTGRGWELEVLARGEPQPAHVYRQAASALPAPVLAAIDARIEGETFDAPAERRALQQGWLRLEAGRRP